MVGGGGGKLTNYHIKPLKLVIAVFVMTILSHYICPISIFKLGEIKWTKAISGNAITFIGSEFGFLIESGL